MKKSTNKNARSKAGVSASGQGSGGSDLLLDLRLSVGQRLVAKLIAHGKAFSANHLNVGNAQKTQQQREIVNVRCTRGRTGMLPT